MKGNPGPQGRPKTFRTASVKTAFHRQALNARGGARTQPVALFRAVAAKSRTDCSWALDVRQSHVILGAPQPWLAWGSAALHCSRGQRAASDGALDVQVAYWLRRRHGSARQGHWISPEGLDEAWSRSARKVRREERLSGHAKEGGGRVQRSEAGGVCTSQDRRMVEKIAAPTSPGKFGNRT